MANQDAIKSGKKVEGGKLLKFSHPSSGLGCLSNGFGDVRGRAVLRHPTQALGSALTPAA